MDQLEEYRRKIDKIDRKLLQVLAERFLLVKKIGQYKKQRHLSPLDKARFKKILQTRTAWGQKRKLPKELVKKIFNLIHNFALKIESR